MAFGMFCLQTTWPLCFFFFFFFSLQQEQGPITGGPALSWTIKSTVEHMSSFNNEFTFGTHKIVIVCFYLRFTFLILKPSDLAVKEISFKIQFSSKTVGYPQLLIHKFEHGY